jgi:hypothetical protein
MIEITPGKYYEVIKPQELFDNSKYLNAYPKYSWPYGQMKKGDPFPPYAHTDPVSTKNGMAIAYLKAGDVILANDILYQGTHPSRGEFQAIMADFSAPKGTRTGFVWVTYNNNDCVKAVTMPGPDPDPPPPSPERRREKIIFDSNIKKNGIQTKPFTDYDVIFPVFTVKLRVDPKTVSQADKYTLYSVEDGSTPPRLYSTTLTPADNKNKNQNQHLIELRFPKAMADLKYTLEIAPGPDKDGKTSGSYKLFENVPFMEEFVYSVEDKKEEEEEEIKEEDKIVEEKEEEPQGEQIKSENGWVEISLVDEDGQAKKGEKYIIFNENGKEIISGNLDDNGKAKVFIGENVCYIWYPDLEGYDNKV